MIDNGTALRLDELYQMTSHIYGDRNSVRSKEATFVHFVEVCGMLTMHDRRKRREGLDVTDALCKSLGWYFPLLSKLRVRSVEQLVFRKFPGVCPYCREAPHNEANCKLVKGTESTVSHAKVVDIFENNWKNRPVSLNDWQGMFNKIYPRNLNENGRSTIGLFEELGELAESVRVFDAHPHYFLGEAADTFSYLMGLANEHSMREAQEGRNFSFYEEYLSRYPGLCTQCGSRVCVCPSIPLSTVGRMAKEIDLRPEDSIFLSDLHEFSTAGQLAAQSALESVGGYSGLASKVPFDRGDANHGLLQICLKIAAAVENTSEELASTLRAEALKLGDAAKAAGTPREPLAVDDLWNKLGIIWKELDIPQREEIKHTGGITGELVEMLDVVRILFISCNPGSPGSLRLAAEQRAIKESIARGVHAKRFRFEDLPSATTNDLRRALLREHFDLLHFSGHADESNLVFEDETGKAIDVPIAAIAKLVRDYPRIRCVVLNACEAGKKMRAPISPITVAMDEEIPDDAAIEFSRGFYDALAAGLDVERAYNEVIHAVQLAGMDCEYIKIVKE